MNLLCHRGKWALPAEKNTPGAFARAWADGWGLELDLRDLDGDVVVSHDMPRTGALTLEDFLTAYAVDGRGTPLALNVKADGLAGVVAGALRAHEVTDAFVFDMSVPDHLAWLTAGVPCYTRWSDVEPDPVLLERSAGIWLDAFTDDSWWEAAGVEKELAAGRQVALVSPELHGRDPEPVWARIAAAGLHHHPGFTLCTDLPDRAVEVLS